MNHEIALGVSYIALSAASRSHHAEIVRISHHVGREVTVRTQLLCRQS